MKTFCNHRQIYMHSMITTRLSYRIVSQRRWNCPYSGCMAYLRALPQFTIYTTTKYSIWSIYALYVWVGLCVCVCVPVILAPSYSYIPMLWLWLLSYFHVMKIIILICMKEKEYVDSHADPRRTHIQYICIILDHRIWYETPRVTARGRTTRMKRRTSRFPFNPSHRIDADNNVYSNSYAYIRVYTYVSCLFEI